MKSTFIIIFTSVLVIVFSSTLFAFVDSEIIIKGQYIVEVRSDQEFQRFLKQTQSDARFSDLETEKLMEAPFNLWLVKVNPINVYSSQLETALNENRNVLRCVKNKKISLRQTPNDPLFPNQWQFENTGQNNGKVGADMDMLRAWDITTGGQTFSGDTIVVAVLDDGVNGLHPDMNANMWINHNEIPNNDIDDDGNGYIDDYYGWNVKFNNDEVYSDGSHGTPVAGIIGAVGNNEVGVSGVNWNIKILPVDYGEATEARALASYGYVYKMRQMWNETKGEKGAFITVTNASWGSDGLFADEAQLWCRLYDALGSIGVLNIGATSNRNVDVEEVGDMPSTCESEYLIIVTNVNRQDLRHEGGIGSAYGRKSVDLGAFGHQTYTVSLSSYNTFGGTSGATPHVAGLAALMYSAPCEIFDSLIYANPSQAALVVKDMILNGVEANPTLNQITTSGGRINAYNSLSNLMLLCEGCSPPAGVVLIPSDSSVVLQWPFDAGGDISLRYKKADESLWTTLTGIQNGYELQNLDFCSEYELQWSAICGFLPSEFGYSKFFKTNGCCSLPDISQVEIENDNIAIQLSHDVSAQYMLSYSINNGSNIDTVISSKEFQWPHLIECQSVKLTLQSTCSKFNNTSPISQGYIFSTPCGACTENNYCQFGRKDNSAEWIKKLEIGEFKNESKNEPNGYNNFFGSNQIRLAHGMTYPLLVEVGYKNDAFTEYLKAFIDFNQNGVYDDAEEIFNGGPKSFEFNGEFEVPLDALNGFTSMRIILSFDPFEGACDVSEFEFGEVEDYCVFIGLPCLGKVELDTIKRTTQSLIFKLLTSTEDIDSVRIDIKASDEKKWQTYYMKDSLIINDLKSCKLYDYRCFSVCGNISSTANLSDTIKTMCTNSTNDVFNEVSIYPNPTKDIVFIDLGGLAVSTFRMKVRNMDGSILNIKDKISYINERHQIDFSAWNSGVYILTLLTENQEATHYKLVILKD